MLNDQKIKQPQTATLEYYNIEKDGDKHVLLPCFHKILYKTIFVKITCAFKQSQGLILVKSEFGFASEQNQSMILVKSGCDFGKVGVWFW